LPERLEHNAFAPSAPAFKQDSPDCHPFAVIIPKGKPESFTPWAASFFYKLRMANIHFIFLYNNIFFEVCQYIIAIMLNICQFCK